MVDWRTAISIFTVQITNYFLIQKKNDIALSYFPSCPFFNKKIVKWIEIFLTNFLIYFD